jgi:hypothetical protein
MSKSENADIFDRNSLKPVTFTVAYDTQHGRIHIEGTGNNRQVIRNMRYIFLTEIERLTCYSIHTGMIQACEIIIFFCGNRFNR